MATLHIENTVHDFDAWKEAFDKFERFRADQGVLSYRVFRKVDDRNQVVIDLEFAAAEGAVAFGGALEQIWRTPQSQLCLVSHKDPEVYDVVVERDLSAAGSSIA